MAFREIGRVREAMVTFTTIMNMPTPMNKDNFDTINDKLYDTYEWSYWKYEKCCIWRKIINPSCKNDDINDCGVSIDGSFALLNSVVVTISQDNSKVIDAVVLSKFCKGYQIWGKKEGTIADEQWKCIHNCQINHNGSLGLMEAAGAIEIFGLSATKYNLRYSKYLGDAYTVSFTKVVESQPYGDETWMCWMLPKTNRKSFKTKKKGFKRGKTMWWKRDFRERQTYWQSY